MSSLHRAVSCCGSSASARPSAPARCARHMPRALGEKALGGLVLPWTVARVQFGFFS